MQKQPANKAQVRAALKAVHVELRRARSKFPAFHSAHEGIAVLREEYLELEKEVFKRKKKRRRGRMYDEAKQVAAIAVRFMLDCCAKVEEHD